MTELPVSRPFAWEIAVTDADIDAQGHVGNVTIVDWMSRAAWAHSRSLGWGLDDYQRLGGWFVVRRHEVDYHAAAYSGDQLVCYTWPSGLNKATAQRCHRIVRPLDGGLIAEGRNTWAYLDRDSGRPVRIPAELRQAFDPARFI